MRRLVIAAILIAATLFLESRTAPVRGRTDADLSAFDCTQVTQSRLLNRICYDAAHRIALAEIDGRYYAHCNVAPETIDALQEAESMPRFYLSEIRAGHKCGTGELSGSIAQVVVN